MAASLHVLSRDARALTYAEPAAARAEIVLSRSLRDMTLEGRSFSGSRVFDIAVDVNHHAVYLSFTDLRLVLVLDLDLSPIRTIGDGDPGVGQLQKPMGLGLDSAGNLFVTDADRGEVLVYDAGGKFLRAIVVPRDRPDSSPKPSDVAVAGDGTVYVLDDQVPRVIVFGNDGSVSRAFGLPDDRRLPWLSGHLLLNRSQDLIVVTGRGINLVSIEGKHLWAWHGCDRLHNIPQGGSGIGIDLEDRILFSRGWHFHAINLDGQYLFDVPINLPHAQVFNAALFDIGQDGRIYVYEGGSASRSVGVSIVKLLEVPDVAPQCKQLRERNRVDHARAAVSPDTAIEVRTAIQGLHEPDAEKRLDAIKKLEALGEGAILAIPWLIDCLADDALAGEAYRETRIADAAAQALSKIGRPAEELLTGAIRDPDPTIRRNSIWILARKRSPAFLPVFLGGLKDKNLAVQRAAAGGLATLRTVEVFDPLASWLLMRLDILGDNEYALSYNDEGLFRTLADIDRERTLHLVLELLDGRQKRSWNLAVLHVLTRELPDKRALERIAGLLTDTDMVVWTAAFSALREIDPEWMKGESGQRALRTSTQHVEGSDPMTRIAASRTLCSMQDPRAVDPLIRSLRLALRESEVVRWTDMDWSSWQAINCLRGLDNGWSSRPAARELAPYFIEALRDEMPAVRMRAVQYLGNVGEMQALLEVLRDEDKAVRTNAAQVLGTSKDVRAVEPLLALLKDKDLKIPAAAYALGAFKDRRSVDALLGSLSDEDIALRMGAIYALGEIGDPGALEPLLAIAVDKSADPRARDRAAGALRRYDDPKVTRFMKAVFSERDRLFLRNAADHLLWKELKVLYGGNVDVYRVVWDEKGFRSLEYSDRSMKWDSPKERLEEYGRTLLTKLSPLFGFDEGEWRLEKLTQEIGGVTLNYKHEGAPGAKTMRVYLFTKPEDAKAGREITSVRVSP